jgi:SAM-dependent methyltransferase
MTKAIDTYDYDIGGLRYSSIRKTDPSIARQIVDALGGARTVLNVGAGTGSYEPEDRVVIAIEPSSTMRAQRDPNKLPAVIATAEALPFDDDSFDASTAFLTIHHWPHLESGLIEMRRVTRGPMMLMTFDPERVADYWLSEYCPEMPKADGSRFPTMDRLRAILGDIETIPVRIPLDCKDGFQEAFYGRPEMLLLAEIRKAQSGWSFVPEGAEDRFVQRLHQDLESGVWDMRFGQLRTLPFYEGALRLVVSRC